MKSEERAEMLTTDNMVPALVMLALFMLIAI